ncbi:MAG: hypothetical protein PF542_05920 [Nanoarchaeota archaeon]|jgi:2,3-bisphosphoglycerate-independent phosphoglycerate mutase|nr:hypothetical protein [Nanoarchaeota archaeon]
MVKEIKMKGIFVVIGGLSDGEVRQLGGKTPLEAAYTPNLDFLATRGQMANVYPIKQGYVPTNKESILSYFDNEADAASLGWLEARGAGLELSNGDLALRVNLGTINSIENGEIIDRRAGRTLSFKESKKLSKAINKMNFPHEFEFVMTQGHRGVLVFRGNYSDSIVGNDLTYSKGVNQCIDKISYCAARNKDKLSLDTAEILNEFIYEAHVILNEHSVNKKRRSRGLLPANYLFVRGGGVATPKLKRLKHWVSCAYSPVSKGISKYSGMKTYPFKYPKLKGIDVYKNLWDGLRLGIAHSQKIIKKNMKKENYAFVYFPEVDVCGLDNKPFEKKAILEYLDKTFFRFLSKLATMNNLKVVVTGDCTTVSKLKAHSSDPVPIMLYDGQLPRERKYFNEISSRKGVLKRMVGCDLLKRVGFR